MWALHSTGQPLLPALAHRSCVDSHLKRTGPSQHAASKSNLTISMSVNMSHTKVDLSKQAPCQDRQRTQTCKTAYTHTYNHAFSRPRGTALSHAPQTTLAMLTAAALPVPLPAIDRTTETWPFSDVALQRRRPPCCDLPRRRCRNRLRGQV